MPGSNVPGVHATQRPSAPQKPAGHSTIAYRWTAAVAFTVNIVELTGASCTVAPPPAALATRSGPPLRDHVASTCATSGSGSEVTFVLVLADSLAVSLAGKRCVSWAASIWTKKVSADVRCRPWPGADSARAKQSLLNASALRHSSTPLSMRPLGTPPSPCVRLSVMASTATPYTAASSSCIAVSLTAAGSLACSSSVCQITSCCVTSCSTTVIICTCCPPGTIVGMLPGFSFSV
eukprot:3049352-Prymnesium_polylepis.1